MGDETVEAMFPYTYQAGDGRTIEFEKGDQFTLLNKTNDDWWQVTRTRKDTTHSEEKPIYVPASYMKEIPSGSKNPIYENVECNGEVVREDIPAMGVPGRHSNTSNRSVPNDVNRDGYSHNGTNYEDEKDTRHTSDASSDFNSMAESLESSGSFSSPRKERPKSQSLPRGWIQLTDEATGRPCYFNSHTQEKSWKPPRISHSGTTTPDGWPTPPLGWRISHSSSTDELCYVNDCNDEEWMLSKDEDGRVYYYQVNGNVTAWELPEGARRSASVQSRESVSSAEEWPMPPTPSTDFVDFFQAIEKQGMLNCKKLVEGGGKKVKKMSWTPTFVILFSANLVFYKDQKAAAQKPGHPQGKPQSCCPLQGATIEWGSSSSTKKKNAFQIKAFSGAVYLLQHDHQVEATNWFSAISAVIKRLNEEEPFPAPVPSQDQSQQGDESDVVSPEPGTPSSLQPQVLIRVPSTRKGVDREDKRNMRDKLKKFLTKRPPIEELEKRGIIKESVFGCHISHLCERQKTPVPVFVSSCIAAIEKRGLSFDGLYRVCGNVSTVQKLRIMVDQEEKVVLGEPPFDDVHALTGSLKLYFRELPEPLIPYDFFSGFVEAIKQSTRKGKLTAMRSLAVQMPKVNGETLKLLLRHLRKLMDQSEANRMNAQNLAIVWGPNLMWPRYDSGDIAVNMVHQNQIIEFLLLEFDSVFK